MHSEKLCFPSGRSVANCKNDAKRLTKNEGIPHHQALDRVAKENGLAMPFHKAVEHIRRHSATPVMSMADIQTVMDRHPGLTHTGIGLPPRVAARATPKEYLKAFEQERESLLSAVDECNRAHLFLSHLEKRKTINTSSSSYGLKHQVEGFGRRLGLENPYVANGAFICAAIHLGFDFRRLPNGSTNVWINYSGRSPAIEWRRFFERKKSGLLHTDIRRDKLAKLESVLRFPNPYHKPFTA